MIGKLWESSRTRAGLYSGPGHVHRSCPRHSHSPRRTSYTCLDAEYPIIMTVSLELLLLNTDRPLLQPTLDRTRMAWVTQ
jgi:hypothetical protein